MEFGLFVARVCGVRAVGEPERCVREPEPTRLSVRECGDCGVFGVFKRECACACVLPTIRLICVGNGLPVRVSLSR